MSPSLGPHRVHAEPQPAAPRLQPLGQGTPASTLRALSRSQSFGYTTALARRPRSFRFLLRLLAHRASPIRLPSLGARSVGGGGRQTRDDLKGVGILGQNPSVSFNVSVSDDERKHIAIALVHLSRQASRNNVEKYISGTRKFIPRILTLNGNGGWVSTVKTLSSPLAAGVLWAPAPVQGVSSGENVTFYTCKQCDLVVPSTCTSFQYVDLDRKHKCMHCKKSPSVKDWSCECGVNWFSCALHACPVVHGNQPLHSHVQATEQPASSKSLKRALNVIAPETNRQHKEYLGTGVKRFCDRSAAVITLSDCAVTPQERIKYGPILSKRFSSCASSSRHA